METHQEVREKLTLDFLEDKKCFCYDGIKKYLTNTYRDFMSVFLVFLFLSIKWNQTFLDFLYSFHFDQELNPKLYKFLSDYFKEIQDVVKYFSREDSFQNIELLWDLHWVHNTKVFLTDTNWTAKIAVWNNYASDNLIIGLFESLTNQKTKFSPMYYEKESYIYRDFLSYSNDFASWKDIAKFYQIFWEKTAFLLALRTTDLHYENFLISNNNPYFFDFECIFAPFINDFPYSITLSWIVDDQLSEEKFWPLFWWRDLRESYLTPLIKDYGKNPIVKRTIPSKYKKLHIPKSWESTINPYLFKSEFFQGFSFMENEILKNQNKFFEIINHQNIYNRILFRPTRVYSALIKETIMKFSLLQEFEVDDFLYKKLRILPVFTPINDKENLIQEEIKQLKIWIIPYFYSEIHDKWIFNNKNEYICSLMSSCYNEFVNHFHNLKSFYLETKNTINFFYTKIWK